jgi:hypothetical protein
MDINALLSELGEVESELTLLTERKDILRQEIAKVMAERNNEKLVVEGLGTVTVTKDRTSIKYDTKKLDAFVAQCLKDGDIHTATAISEARSETTSKGYLVIKKEW